MVQCLRNLPSKCPGPGQVWGIFIRPAFPFLVSLSWRTHLSLNGALVILLWLIRHFLLPDSPPPLSKQETSLTDPKST